MRDPFRRCKYCLLTSNTIRKANTLANSLTWQGGRLPLKASHTELLLYGHNDKDHPLCVNIAISPFAAAPVVVALSSLMHEMAFYALFEAVKMA